MRLTVYRFNPEVDDKPYLREYEIDTQKTPLVMVLDALKWVKNEQDETLSFRRSCGEGVCGSCGTNINGKNTLACITPLKDCSSHITVRPLTGMPVIRDLVVDMTRFYQQYEKVEPYLKTHTVQAQGKERLQSIEDREKLDGLYECILCGCCSSACPSYWWNPDKFLGPAAALQAARFIEDSRDEYKRERLEQLEDAYSIFRCRSILSCASVCPKGLNPGKAIAGIRHRLLSEGT